MSHFRLHTNRKEREYRKYLAAGLICLMVAGGLGYGIHGIGRARARSRETVFIHTEEEFCQYLLDRESEEYNLNGRYRLEEDLDLSWLDQSIGTNIEPFKGSLDGNGHAIRGLTRPLFGVMKEAKIENLFLSEAEISHPFTYYDGEHYVDGYAALTAYAIDSDIRNCGMGGDIYTASPSEAEYQLALATPFDAEEKGPGAETREEISVESSPVLEGGGSGGGPAGTEAGPGAERSEDTSEDTGHVGTEENTEAGPGIETTAEGESGTIESSSGESESSAVHSTDREEEADKESGTGQNDGTNQENGTAETEAGTGTPSGNKNDGTIIESVDATTVAMTETETGAETKAETKAETEELTEAVSGEVTRAVPEAASGEVTRAVTVAVSGEVTRAVTVAVSEELTGEAPKAASGTAPKAAPKVAIKGNQMIPVETIGFHANDRQHLFMKIPERIGVDMEEVVPDAPSNAVPSNATPSNATPPDASEEISGDESEHQNPEETGSPGEPEYIGNPDGDIYILVTADRMKIGGLVAEAAGETLISNSFTMVNITSVIREIDTYTGGMAGILGVDVRVENSYATGTAGSDGTIGGFAAVNRGMIENSYSSMSIGTAGGLRGAFTADGNGRLSGCVYDRQMACMEQEEIEDTGNAENTSKFTLQGLDTVQMTGNLLPVPGDWYTTEQGYPQLPAFAQSENEAARSYSMASAVALILPEGTTILNAMEKSSDIFLPSEIDGAEIQWSVDGDAAIDENNQVKINTKATITPREVLLVSSSLNTEAVEEETLEEPVPPERPEEITFKATTYNVTKTFAPVSQTAAADIPADWSVVGKDAAAPQCRNPASPETAGTEDNPFLIGTPAELAWFAYQVDYNRKSGYCAQLTNNIDLFGKEYTGISPTYSDGKVTNMDSALKWIPIGVMVGSGDQRMFGGHFDGAGYEIFNIRINGGYEGQGLFGWVVDNAIIENLGMASGSIINVRRGGGVVGEIRGDVVIRNCWSNVDISGAQVGGIVGYLLNGLITIEGCYNTGNIEVPGGRSTLSDLDGGGGITGSIWRSEIKYPLITTIRNCYNLGTVTTPNAVCSVGGIVGWRNTSPEGEANLTIENCYNAGLITGQVSGSIIGKYLDSANPIVNCYYDKQTSGTVDPLGLATPVTTDELKSWEAAYALNGQKMRQSGGISWAYDENGVKYPFIGELTALSNWGNVITIMRSDLITVEGLSETENGSPENPYHINSPEQLAQFAHKVNHGSPALCAELTADINLFGSDYIQTIYAENDSTMKTKALSWIPIAYDGVTYRGTFNGNGHTISLINARDKTGAKPQGLFGTVGEAGKITGVGIRDSIVAGEEAGGITGRLKGTAEISKCFIREGSEFQGTGIAGAYIGGIAGRLYDNSVIKDCYGMDTIGSVIGSGSYAGGITGGINGGAGVYNSYISKVVIDISSGAMAGSIAGTRYTGGTVAQCYSDVRYLGDSRDRIKLFDTSTDEKRQEQVDDLNTITGVGQRTGTDRAWYTSLAAETTHGMPTLKAPEILTVTVNPADVTADVTGAAPVLTGSTGSLTGTSLPADIRFRGSHREKSSDTDYTLTRKADVSTNYLKYGSVNANKNLSMTAGTKDLAELTASLTEPGGTSMTGSSFSSLTLYNGGAYIYPSERTLLIDLAEIPESGEPVRYEIRVTVAAVTGKMLSVVMGTPGKIELVPGKENVAYTQDLKLENRCTYPLQVNIASVKVKERNAGSIDVELNPVSQTIDSQKPLVSEGIRLGIVKPLTAADTGGIGEKKLYYIPPAADAPSEDSAKWITGQMEGKQILWYGYFMEYSHVYLGPGNEKFGYEINYRFELPEADATGIQVAAN